MRLILEVEQYTTLIAMAIGSIYVTHPYDSSFDVELFATYFTIRYHFSPVSLWDHALHRRAWTIRVDANTSEFAVDGNNSTYAETFATEYPFLAVDLGTMLKIDYVVLNIKRGKLCTFIIGSTLTNELMN